MAYWMVRIITGAALSPERCGAGHARGRAAQRPYDWRPAMQQTTEFGEQQVARPADGAADIKRFFIALAALLGVLVFLWLGFEFLRSNAHAENPVPPLIVAAFAIVWGVGGV